MSEKDEHTDWVQKRCKPCERGATPLSEQEVLTGVKRLEGWAYEGGQLVRTFTFKNYHQTMAFVNAVAYIAHTEDHHPDMEVGYKTCKIRYVTHAVGGISDNDFICAAKVSRLVH